VKLSYQMISEILLSMRCKRQASSKLGGSGMSLYAPRLVIRIGKK
jgi:hypothetical protein